jgi:hypothetical protein
MGRILQRSIKDSWKWAMSRVRTSRSSTAGRKANTTGCRRRRRSGQPEGRHGAISLTECFPREGARNRICVGKDSAANDEIEWCMQLEEKEFALLRDSEF